MEDHEAVKIGVVWVEVARLVDVVVMFDKSADLHSVRDAVLDDGTEWIERRSLRERQLLLTVGHGLGTNEV